VFSLSGYEGWEVPGGSIVASGNNLSGLNVLLTGATGDYVHALNTSSSGIDFDPVNNIQTVSFSVPTGIRNASHMIFSGQSNSAIYQPSEMINSLAVVTGIDGTGVGGAIATGAPLSVTGVNFYMSPSQVVSGAPIALISGTGYNLGVTGEATGGIFSELYETGMSGVNNTFVSVAQCVSKDSFIGTGHLLLLNGGESTVIDGGYGSLYNSYRDSDSYDFAPRQKDYFSDPLVFNGTWVDATGFGPEMGVTGSSVEISGQGFSAVDTVYFSPVSESVAYAVLAGDFTLNSDNKITVKVPKVTVSEQTAMDILLSGGTHDSIGTFAVLPDAPVFISNVLEADATITIGDNQVGIFSIIENVNGVPYVVTYERFSDGTVARGSSVPAP